MNIIVIGGTGQLGKMILVRGKAGGHKMVGLGQKDIEVSWESSVNNILSGYEQKSPLIDAVINCAAVHDLNWCEVRPLRAFEVNAIGSINVAKACERLGALYVYISTNYVLDGRENENPLNVYGLSKLTGEKAAMIYTSRFIVARSGSMYGPHPCLGKKGNFVDNLLRRLEAGESEFKMVDDQIANLTRTDYIADMLLDAITLAMEKSPPLNRVFSPVSPRPDSFYTYTVDIMKYFEPLLERKLIVHHASTDNTQYPKRPLVTPLWPPLYQYHITDDYKKPLIQYLMSRYQERTKYQNEEWINPEDIDINKMRNLEVE